MAWSYSPSVRDCFASRRACSACSGVAPERLKASRIEGLLRGLDQGPTPFHDHPLEFGGLDVAGHILQGIEGKLRGKDLVRSPLRNLDPLPSRLDGRLEDRPCPCVVGDLDAI